MFRVGFGYDSHQLVKGRKLILGGVEIDSDRGCLGHSDGDALIHAICDSLLGAASLKDIGYHFPDTSDEFKGIDSRILLKRTIDLIMQNGWDIENIDTTICLESPRLKEYIPEMVDLISQVMEIDISQLNIKATTNEQMGFVGRQEGVAVYAIAMLSKLS